MWVREQVSRIPEEEIRLRAALLCAKLEDHPLIQQASYCMVYWELANELPISPWFLKHLNEPVRIMLPRVQGLNLEACILRSESEVQSGAYGIPEPITPGIEEVRLRQLKDWVVLVPGVAFDARGGRLGRGKGFYDRFLHQFPNACPIGVCYREQLLPEIAMEEHDIRMKEIIMV